MERMTERSAANRAGRRRAVENAVEAAVERRSNLWTLMNYFGHESDVHNGEAERLNSRESLLVGERRNLRKTKEETEYSFPLLSFASTPRNLAYALLEDRVMGGRPNQRTTRSIYIYIFCQVN